MGTTGWTSTTSLVEVQSVYQLSQGESNMDSDNKPHFVTSQGRDIRILPVSQVTIARIRQSLVDEYIAKGAVLNPPKYTVKDVAGTEQEFYHNESTIESQPEAKQDWYAYVKDTTDLDNAIKDKVTKYMYMHGMVVPEDSTPEWLEEQQWLGLAIPENRLDAKFNYILDCVLVTNEDKTGAMLQIIRVSGVKSEVLQAVEDSFRGIPSEGESKDSVEPTTDPEGDVGE